MKQPAERPKSLKIYRKRESRGESVERRAAAEVVVEAFGLRDVPSFHHGLKAVRQLLTVVVVKGCRG